MFERILPAEGPVFSSCWTGLLLMTQHTTEIMPSHTTAVVPVPSVSNIREIDSHEMQYLNLRPHLLLEPELQAASEAGYSQTNC
ncbi:hypothetical protein INR49_019628 [Caranx melampygus]|nr:hypothetical protein INR49_019628 [Caranx melampygus]